MRVTRAEALNRVRLARVGRMATLTPEGRPHVVPFVFVLIGEDADLHAYWLVDRKQKRSRFLRRVENIKANAAVEFVVDGYDEDWDRLWWVRVSGTGRVVRSRTERAKAIAALRAKYPQYAATPQPGPLIGIDIDRISGWEAGGLPRATGDGLLTSGRSTPVGTTTDHRTEERRSR
jgi:PPOX class probable F420-dependent enzyme